MSDITVGEMEWAYTQNLCLFINWLASAGSKKSMKASELVAISNDFFMKHPNVNESLADYAEFIEAPVGWVEAIWGGPFGGQPEFYSQTVAMVNEVIPVLGHPTAGTSFLPVFVVLTLVCSIFLGLRFYSRITINGKLQSYDWLIIVGFVLAFASGIMRAVVSAVNKHFIGVWDQSWNDYDAIQASGLASNMVYPVTVFFIKSSLLLFYYHLTVWDPIRYASIGVFVIVLCNTLASFWAFTFRCVPVLGWHGENFLTATCNVDPWKLELGASVVNIFTDITIWLLPLPMIWKIIRSNRERFLSCLTFGIGALACIACGLRLSTIHYAFYSSKVGENSDGTIVGTWTQIELYLAIICSCVPAVRALIMKKVPKILGISETDDSVSENTKEKYNPSQDKQSAIDISSRSIHSGAESPV